MEINTKKQEKCAKILEKYTRKAAILRPFCPFGSQTGYIPLYYINYNILTYKSQQNELKKVEN